MKKFRVRHGACGGAPETSFEKDLGRNRAGAMRLRQWAVQRYGTVGKAAGKIRVHVNAFRFIPARYHKVRDVEIIRNHGDRLLDMLEIEAQS